MDLTSSENKAHLGVVDGLIGLGNPSNTTRDCRKLAAPPHHRHRPLLLPRQPFLLFLDVFRRSRRRLQAGLRVIRAPSAGFLR